MFGVMRVRETDLYAPVKAFLGSQGYEVKAEVGDCDILAVRGDEDPLVVELKSSATLSLVLQGIDRQEVTDTVYLAVPAKTLNRKRGGRKQVRRFVKLCRRLGLGLLLVHLDAGSGWVEAAVDPEPYAPRKNKKRETRLLREFQQRVGDPNVGGTNGARMTAYRQHALRCVGHLARTGTAKIGDVQAQTGVGRAGRILQRDVYGWFERVTRGVYRLSPRGLQAVESNAVALAALDGTGQGRGAGKPWRRTNRRRPTDRASVGLKCDG